MTQNYECWDINGGILEYYDDEHCYIYNGVILPSITTIMRVKFKNKYKGVDLKTLNKAAQKGTAVHNAIEQYYKNNVDTPECKELRNMKFLQRLYNFEVVDNEIPIVLFIDGKPVAAGRLDLVLKLNDKLMLGDIKRTSSLDKEYLAYQLNLYKIGYEQCYGKKIEGLRGVHLREDVRKFVEIPINEKMALDLVHQYLEEQNGV